MSEGEKIARALCKADGHNPDDRVVPQGVAIAWNQNGVVLPEGVELEPLWQRYSHYVPLIRELIKNGVEPEPEPEHPEIKDIAPRDWRDRYGLNGVPRVRSTFTPPK